METLHDLLHDFFVNDTRSAKNLMHCENSFVMEDNGDGSEVIVCVYDGTDDGGDKSLAGVSLAYIDNYGGEDQGSAYWSIYKFKRFDEELFIRFNGYYASHYGSEYEGFEFVKPVEKTIIVYE